jgi:nucleoside-diphosphate-sugar epimerase
VRIFVAGATGAIGSQLVPMLVARGHTVVGMTRSPERAAWLTRAGAEACVCDVYDRDRLGAAVAEARPEVVIHQLTALPQRYDMRRRDVTAATDRIRREGTANLVAAARAAGCERVVAQSIAFLYRPGDGAPGALRTEADAPFADAPQPFGAAVAALVDLERQVLGLDGAVLRYGWLYGPGTWFAPDGHFSAEVRRRRYPIVGNGAGVWSFVHVADAAGAAAQVAESGVTGVFNIVDDDPAPIREWLPELARALSAKPPLRVPRWVARIVAGPVAGVMARQMPGASNAQAREELGWRPRYPTWRERLGRSH